MQTDREPFLEERFQVLGKNNPVEVLALENSCG